jgi:hypothetical protein
MIAGASRAFNAPARWSLLPQVVPSTWSSFTPLRVWSPSRSVINGARPPASGRTAATGTTGPLPRPISVCTRRPQPHTVRMTTNPACCQARTRSPRSRRQAVSPSRIDPPTRMSAIHDGAA